MTSWYDQAELYDVAFSFSPEREIAFLLELFRRAGVSSGGAILEPMVGSGRLVPPLQSAGYSVFGFDKSPAMLRIAQARAPTASLFLADAGRFHCEARFDAAHCLIDSFRYLLSVDAATRFFESLADCLRPGSPFLLGIDLASDLPDDPESWTTTRGDLRLTTTLRRRPTADPAIEVMEVTLDHTRAGHREVTRSSLPQRRWRPDEFCRFLDAVPEFAVAGIWHRTYDLARPLDSLPARGGSVVLALIRTADCPQP